MNRVKSLLRFSRFCSLSVASCLFVASLALLAPAVQASGMVTHTYDEFSGNGNHVGTFYAGFTYSGDDEVLCSYSSVDFPPTTGPCVIGPQSSSFTITATLVERHGKRPLLPAVPRTASSLVLQKVK